VPRILFRRNRHPPDTRQLELQSRPYQGGQALHGYRIFRKLLCIFGLLLLASPLVSQTGEWGEPFEGLQARLAASKAVLPRAGELPQFEFQLRNTGKEAGPISSSHLGVYAIEIAPRA
jgi:hypothetical protein